MTTQTTCNCSSKTPDADNKWQRVSSKSARSLPSILLSILIAFFPKCAVCWAVYMSMFGSIGLTKLPYLPWLLPVFTGLLLFHVAMQYRTIRLKGPLPFCCSLAGVTCLLLSRFLYPGMKPLMIAGMAFIVLGSLLASFAARPLKVQVQN
ncbi:hypothetical protein [Chitinophaga sp. Cy-1792]|uniref:hypothetical protein n=1 Tax=Chitinophaga sp. Cy-1792 TaxID=2608339 RepID=UPI00142067D9|nr:hypothetical protein [Chitinophaga sp. Cy-1792]NIG56415.1 hypothetical protein [Chitinophaga sp. Cy-1792]